MFSTKEFYDGPSLTATDDDSLNFGKLSPISRGRRSTSSKVEEEECLSGLINVKPISISNLKYLKKSQHPFLRMSLLEPSDSLKGVESEIQESSLAREGDASIRKWPMDDCNKYKFVSDGRFSSLAIDIWCQDDELVSKQESQILLGYLEINLNSIPILDEEDKSYIIAPEEFAIINEVKSFGGKTDFEVIGNIELQLYVEGIGEGDKFNTSSISAVEISKMKGLKFIMNKSMETAIPDAVSINSTLLNNTDLSKEYASNKKIDDSVSTGPKIDSNSVINSTELSMSEEHMNISEEYAANNKFSKDLNEKTKKLLYNQIEEKNIIQDKYQEKWSKFYSKITQKQIRIINKQLKKIKMIHIKCITNWFSIATKIKWNFVQRKMRLVRLLKDSLKIKKQKERTLQHSASFSAPLSPVSKLNINNVNTPPKSKPKPKPTSPSKSAKPSYINFVSRSRISNALIHFRYLYEENMCSVKGKGKPITCISSSKVSMEHGRCRQLQFESRAHKNESWLEVASVLHGLEKDDQQSSASKKIESCSCLTEFGKCKIKQKRSLMFNEWLDWTHSSRKVLINVLISEENATKLSIKDDEGKISRTIQSLRYNFPRLSKIVTIPGKAANYVRENLNPREILLNKIYDNYCIRVWMHNCHSLEQKYLKINNCLSILIKMAEEDKLKKQNEIENKQKIKTKTASKQWVEWCTVKLKRLENQREPNEKMTIEEITERQLNNQEKYECWLTNKNRINEAVKLLCKIDADRAMNSIQRSEVGWALFSISPTLLNDWLLWLECKRESFEFLNGTVNVQTGSMEIISSHDFTTKLLRGDAILINKAVYTISLSGRFDDKIITLSTPYRNKTMNNVMLHKCSDINIKSLQKEWYSYHSAILPIENEKLEKYLTAGKKFINVEKRRLYLLEMHPSNSSMYQKDKEQVQKNIQLAEKELLELSRVDHLIFTNEHAKRGGTKGLFVRVFSPDGSLSSFETEASIFINDHICLDLDNNWLKVKAINLFKRSMYLKVDHNLKSMGKGQLCYAINQEPVEFVEDEHEFTWLSFSKLCSSSSTVLVRKATTQEIFQIPHVNPDDGLNILQNLAKIDSAKMNEEKKEMTQKYNELSKEESKRKHSQIVEEAKILSLNLSPNRALKEEVWRQVGMTYYLIDPSLKQTFLEWTRNTNKWKKFETDFGFVEEDLRMLIDDIWVDFENENENEEGSDKIQLPQDAFQLLKVWVDEDIYPNIKHRKVISLSQKQENALVIQITKISSTFASLKWFLDIEGSDAEKIILHFDIRSAKGYSSLYVGTGKQLNIPCLNPNSTYFFRAVLVWHFQSEDGEDTYEKDVLFGNFHHLSLTTLPLQPDPPRCIQQYVAGSQRFAVIAWTSPKYGASRYSLQVARSNFANQEVEDDDVYNFIEVYNGHNLKYTLNDLTPNSIYKIRVSAINTSGYYGEFSLCSEIRTPMPAAIKPFCAFISQTSISLKWKVPSLFNGIEENGLVKVIENPIDFENLERERIMKLDEEKRQIEIEKMKKIELAKRNLIIVNALKIFVWYSSKKIGREIRTRIYKKRAARKIVYWIKIMNAKIKLQFLKHQEHQGAWIPHLFISTEKLATELPFIYYVHSISKRRVWASHTSLNQGWQLNEEFIVNGWGEWQHWWDNDNSKCYLYNPLTGESKWGCVNTKDDNNFSNYKREIFRLRKLHFSTSKKRVEKLSNRKKEKGATNSFLNDNSSVINGSASVVEKENIDLESNLIINQVEKKNQLIDKNEILDYETKEEITLVQSLLYMSVEEEGQWDCIFKGWESERVVTFLKPNTLYFFKVKHYDVEKQTYSVSSDILKAATLAERVEFIECLLITPTFSIIRWQKVKANKYIVESQLVLKSGPPQCKIKEYEGRKDRCKVYLARGKTYNIFVSSVNHLRKKSESLNFIKIEIP